MSTLKSINVVHPSGTVNNIVNDDSGNVTVGGAIASKAPSTINAATYSMLSTDSSLIFTTTSNTLTLLSAASYSGRILYVKNVTANSVTSATSNVVPLGSTAAGTAILSASAGKFAMLQSDGTNWIIMLAN
jgi:hypothetical protein